jgi:hypothetical protein
MSIPDDYKVDHLFLLIGRNPLPNYVVAELLLKPDGTLYLVHSEGKEGTGKVAQRLAKYFRHHPYQSVPVSLQDTDTLRSQIEHHLKQIGAGTIGLNYTGGTKVMAIHSYRAIEQFCQQRGGVEPVYSYLDANSLELVIEPRPALLPWRRKVVQDVEVPLKTLLDIHGIRLKGKLQTDPQHPKLVRALAQMHGSSSGIKAWQDSRKVLKGGEDRLWQAIKVDILAAGTPLEVVQHLERLLKVTDPQRVNLKRAARQAGLKSSRELGIWVDGTWLENWALTCVKELGYEHRARSVDGFMPVQFEIDVAVMRGYQLFALSCSVTTDPRKAKQKLLEIYARARQIGGDEVRLGVVCPVEDTDKLKQQIAQAVGTANRVGVFGRKHIPNLKRHLKQWFESV